MTDKPMREISIEGCELIGKGGNGAVYGLDPETIVKVYYGDRNSPEKIDQNREVTKRAFVQGVPTTIAFDMVRVGENYGVVYEMIDAKSLAQEIAAKRLTTRVSTRMSRQTALTGSSIRYRTGILSYIRISTPAT